MSDTSKPDLLSPAPKTDEGAGPPPLEVKDLTVAYQRKPVIWDVELSLPAGKLVAVVPR